MRYSNQLGQTQPNYPFYYPYGGTVIDPRLETALTSFATAVRPTDPGGPLAVQTLRELVAAPGTQFLPPGPGQAPRIAKLSDLQPLLETMRSIRYNPPLTFVAQNPLITAILVIGGAYYLNRYLKQRG